ncbi:MAG: Outer membrane protein assembly factor BamA [Syntrophus sp. SKADARSKE-3]|nr:Outer membrane protein assembly factor BamA [Syntrophus sp. SKADARSKE-3]
METLIYRIKNIDFLKLSVIIAVLFLSLTLGFKNGYTADAVKVAVWPFQVYSKANPAFLQDAVYDSLTKALQKSKSIDIVEKSPMAAAIKGKTATTADALEAGKTVGATHVIMGTLTEIGDRLNLDVKIVETATGKIYPPISVQGKGMENLSALTAQIRDEILIRISIKQRIAKIGFSGNQKIESSVILQAAKSKQGSLYSETQLASDIKAIYKLGYFDDVAADVEDTADGKVITFNVKEKGLVTAIVIKGNKVIDTGDIESALTFKTKQTLNQEKLNASIEKIKALYDGKGYYNAEITPTTEKIGEKDLRVILTIKENEKLYVKKISFEGNHTYRDKDLKNIMKTNEKDFFYFFTDAGILKKDQLKQDVGKLNAFYLNNGFINAQVGEPEITYDKKGIYIKIPIVEGRRFKVGKVNVSGDTIKTPKATILAGLTITKKEFFDREAIIKDIEYLTATCNDEGYAYADINPRTQPNEKEQTVDVTYDISKGPIVYINKINILGNTKTRDKVIRGMLAIYEGDMYNSTKLKQSYKNLERLKYFEEVDFQTEKGPTAGLSDISIRVKEKSTGMFSIGAGYSALDGAMLMASITQQNLFGRGQALTLKATVGQNANYYNLAFTEPTLFDTLIWSKWELWNTRRYYDTYSLASTGFSGTLGYQLWERVYGYLQYQIFNSDVYDVLVTASDQIKQQAGKVLTSALTPTLTRNTTDDDYFPTKGSVNSIFLTYAGGILGGDSAYTKYGASTAWFFALPLEMVFDIKGRIGYLQANEGKTLPVYERFYVGGITTIRGLRNVGPKDPITGDLIGGSTLLYLNFDIVFPLLKSAGMKGVVFFDTGNAWQSGYNLNDLRKTVGAGIRWYSPVGPLRLEWGYVLDRKTGEDPYRFEFTMGMMM